MFALLAPFNLPIAYASPPGSNDWSCQPSTSHPRPVVLVHGTFENMDNNWTLLSAELKSNGYCVYALNYGGTPLSLGVFYGLAAVKDSAQELSHFIEKVRTNTGADKVDIVGHSQGGMMPRYYIKSLNGAGKVGTLVGIASSNHGTTWSGLASLADNFPDILNIAKWLAASVSITLQQAFGIIAPSTTDQTVGSAFLADLNGGGDTFPGVVYRVIATRLDEVVTPYQSAFLTGPAVTNILLQDQCAADISGHIAAATVDGITRRNVLNALDPAHAVPPTCADL
ncbi:triacylglycerol lipase [Pseudomonas sp. CHM02]|uniref:esterase/lipase family protein n=1 Tax=Pseudomonas sp. CHM02 TaxID=1463662 RepID=UPI0004717E3B|nr:alpha/beta fold hydrolase [Pseudomonas sp. CHM02]